MRRPNYLKFDRLTTIFIGFFCCLILIEIGLFISAYKNNPGLSSQVKALVKKCVDDKDLAKYNCYGSAINALNLDFIIKTELVNELSAADSELKNCHVVAHTIAYHEVDKNPDQWQQLIREVNPSICNGGYLHGIFQYYLTNNHEPLTLPLIKKICVTPDDNRQLLINCIHMIGHIALFENPSQEREAIKICGELPEDMQPFHCYAGFFMEYTQKTNLIEHGMAFGPIKVDAQSVPWLENFCQSFSGLAADGCWQEMGRIYLEYYRKDYVQVFQACQRSGNIDATKYCQRFSAMLLAVNQVFDPPALVKVCGYFKSDPDFQIDCQISVDDVLIGNSTKYTNLVFDTCKLMPDQLQAKCLDRAISKLKSVADYSIRRKVCVSLPSSYRQVCEQQD